MHATDRIVDDSVAADGELLGIPPRSVVATTALTGGRGGRTWRIDTDDHRYVLHRRGGTVADEARATAAAHVAGVGPEVIAHQVDAGLLLTRWIPGRAASTPGLAGEHLAPALAALRSLHTVIHVEGRQVGEAIRRIDPLQVRSDYLARAATTSESPVWSRDALRHHQGLEVLVEHLAQVSQIRPAVLIHGDPVAGNVIVTADGARLVDFEYAGAGDSWYELGHLAGALHCEPTGIESLVQTYADGAADATMMAAVEAWSYLSAQAWVAWVVIGEDPGARSPRWQRWAVRAASRLEYAATAGRFTHLAAQLPG